MYVFSTLLYGIDLPKGGGWQPDVAKRADVLDRTKNSRSRLSADCRSIVRPLRAVHPNVDQTTANDGGKFYGQVKNLARRRGTAVDVEIAVLA